MREAICMTLIATSGNNIDKVLQKKGTLVLPLLSFKLKSWCGRRGVEHYRDITYEDTMTRGMKHGRVIVVSTCTSVASIITGVIVGMLALGEKISSRRIDRILLMTG